MSAGSSRGHETHFSRRKRSQSLVTSTATLMVAAFAALAQIPRPEDAPKPRSPEESAAAFRVPEGFRVEVMASEPLIASPSAVCWDERGRMFVSELHGYNLAGELDIEELNKTGKLDTEVRRVQADQRFKEAAKPGTYGVIKLLTDANGDGRMDHATLWATNLPPAYGLVPARGGIIVACAPDIIYFADRDGDNVAETREVLFTGFPTGELERGINAPQWSEDGWIYFGRGWGGGKITGPHLSEPVQLPGTDFRIRADGTAIEPVTGQTHTFGFAMTAAGDRFAATTTVPGIYAAPLPWRYLARNPDLAVSSLQVATGDRHAYGISRPHPWRQKRADDPAYFKFYNSRYGASESEADGWFTSACGPMIYRDDVLPGLHGQYFVCEPAGNFIHRALIKQNGSILELERAPGEEKSEFAATTDAWSHPMNLTHGPGGALWIIDYYREIIEDYSAIPRHLQQQYGVYNGHDRGRIYRLTHTNVPADARAALSQLDVAGLAQECGSPLLWRRQTAQRLLRERNERRGVPALRQALRSQPAPEAAITILFTLDQLGALAPEELSPFIAHTNSAVRIRALQMADPWFSKEEGRELLEATLAQAGAETDPRVQIQFALSLGETGDPRAFELLALYARDHLNIRWMDAAILSSLHGRGMEMLQALLRTGDGTAAFCGQIAQMIGARRDQAELGSTLNAALTAGPERQTAMLNGLAASRKGAGHVTLANQIARKALAQFVTNTNAPVAAAARALSNSFFAVPDDANRTQTNAAVPVSDETFRKFVASLARKRNLQHGHEIFLVACANCHRIGAEGKEVGPDILGEIGLGEESLLKDILMPGEKIRPGFETTEVKMRDGGIMIGLLKSEGATSITLAQAGGLEQVILRKEITGMRRLVSSLMPSFAETLRQEDAADLLGWLRSLQAPQGSAQD
jgi:putative membrane-bound dehydrogenase-like protein